MGREELRYCSTADVAAALGVSVTTIKRWVDEGLLPAHKTPGGHRKILLADVLRLSREGRFPALDLGRLGLGLGTEEGLAQAEGVEELTAALVSGNVAAVRARFHGAYAAGMAVEDLADRWVGPAMHQVGLDWQTGKIDVYEEHRATQTCTAVLHELKARIEDHADQNRPVALGGNPEGDFTVLASLLIQLVLVDMGWDAVNLGAHTPLPSFRRAFRQMKPRLVWLSLTHLPPDPERFLAEYRPLYEECEAAGVPVAVGGLAMHDALRTRMPYTTFGDGLAHLASFARALHPRPRPPKRGRPARE